MSSRLSYNFCVQNQMVNNLADNIKQFFPDLKWEISYEDMKITSSDIKSAVQRLGVKDGDSITLKSDNVWVLQPLVRALPKMRTVVVSDEIRKKLQPQIDILLGFADLDDTPADNLNNNQQFDWNLVNEFMTMYQEKRDPKDGFACCVPLPSLNMIVYASNGLFNRDGFCGGPPSSISCISIDKGRFKIQRAPWMSFDIDEGFSDYNGKPVAYELTEAFNSWVKRGKIGPIFQ